MINPRGCKIVADDLRKKAKHLEDSPSLEVWSELIAQRVAYGLKPDLTLERSYKDALAARQKNQTSAAIIRRFADQLSRGDVSLFDADNDDADTFDELVGYHRGLDYHLIMLCSDAVLDKIARCWDGFPSNFVPELADAEWLSDPLLLADIVSECYKHPFVLRCSDHKYERWEASMGSAKNNSEHMAIDSTIVYTLIDFLKGIEDSE